MDIFGPLELFLSFFSCLQNLNFGPETLKTVSTKILAIRMPEIGTKE